MKNDGKFVLIILILSLMKDFKYSGIIKIIYFLVMEYLSSLLLSRKKKLIMKVIILYYDISQVYLINILDFMKLKIDKNLSNMFFQSFLFKPDDGLLYHEL